MNIKFSYHAEFKLILYGIEKEEVVSALNHFELKCEDTVEDSKIIIIQIRNRLFVVVLSSDSKKLITIYPTDDKTIENRIKKGRWKCK
ncbi:MAG: hypothetical protein HY096_02710 [Nitrospinae bacterium]|nr:hypothetical protein [Nitrospinota bacterium]